MLQVWERRHKLAEVAPPHVEQTPEADGGELEEVDSPEGADEGHVHTAASGRPRSDGTA